ncbi:MAG TPA: hypothetical protein VHA75_12710, partial [Rugosimonospora sp.]|nr:hypothetical protein [Rugosimonospora sp.]
MALDDIVERERLGLGPQHLQPSTEQQTAVADEARDVPGALPFLIGKRRGERTASKQREPSLRRSLIAGTLSRASSRRRSSISQTITPESEFVGTVDPEPRRQLAAAVETARSRANATLQELRQVVTDINAAGERATLIDEIHRLKTLDSLIRKFAADYQARAEDPPEFLARNPDLVRFTVQVAPEYYGQTVRDVLDRLAELGYQHDDADVRNYWRPGNRWYGLGTVVRDQGGREVELQFPTASSREIGKRTHPLYDIVRHPDTPLPRRIDAFLNIIRINKDAGLETNLPQGLDLLPAPQANGLIAFIRPIPDAWADYLNDPRGHAWRFAEALAHHGLSISDVPGLPGLEPHYGQEQIRISGGAHRAGDAGGAHRDASLARPTPGGDLAGSEADLALRSDGGSPDDLQRSVGGEPPAHRPAHGRADRPGSTALRTSTGDAVASVLPRRGHPEAPLEDRPPAHPWADPLLTEARPPRPAEARLEPEDRALLLGDGNHLLAALLYTDLDRIEPAFRWTEQARVELGRLRAEREAGRRAVSTTAISHAVAELRTQLVGRIQRLTRDDLNALVSLRSPELVAAPQGDHTALRAALGRLLDPDAEHGNSLVAPHLLAALFGRSVVIDDGERATLLARAGAIGDPIRLYHRAQTGSGRTEYHAFLARRPPRPQPVPPVAAAAPPRPPADPAVLNHPVPTVQFRLGRSSVLEPHDYFGIDRPTNNLDLIARTTARRVRAMAVGRPPEAAPIIVTIEGDGGRWRLPWRSATRLGLRRAKWLARDLEDRVRRILDRDPANAPMVIFRHQAMTTSGVGGPGPRRTATVWVDIADSWDQGRNFVNDAPGRAPAPQRMSDGRLEQIAYAAGVPAHTLPDLANLVNRLLRLAADHGVRESAEPWDQLAGFLVNNYRHLVGDGMVVFLGHIEVHVRLELTDGQSVARPAVPAPERPEKGRDRLAHAADPKAKTRTTETIHGTFQVGAHSESHAGPTSWLRLGGSHGFTFGVPGRLLQIRLSAAIRFVRNLINRSTGTVRDAEVGRVEDTREDAAHVSARARYHLTVRTDRTQTWDNLPTEVLAAKERMLLALPENYLRRPQPGEAAALAAATRPNQPIPVGANRRLPKVFYASGLTSLHLLADDIIRQLERQRGPIELGHPLRAAVWHRVSNLDTHLDKAVNRYRGYEFTLAENGRIIANVRIRTRRVRARGADPEPIPGAPPPVHRADDLSGRPVSAPSRFAHIEEVRTAISGTSAGTTVTNEGSVEPSLEFVLAKLPKLRFGLKIPYARWTWTNRDSNNSGRTGLWVLVSRYAGHTSAYEMDFEHQATVQTRRRRNVLVRARAALGRPRPATRHGHPGNDYTPTAVRGRAMIRVPTADAVAYGIEPPPPPDVRPPEVEPTTFDPSTIPAVPHHVRSGRGVGMGIVEVDPELVDKLVHRIEQELDRYGYVVHDPDKLFAPSKGRSRKHSSQVNNGTALRKFLSTAALESNYDGAHQGGFHITLRKRHTGWLTNFGVRSARVTIRARQPRDVEDMRVNANPRLTKERHIVNLEMGLDSAGSSAGGGQGWATGVRLRFLPQKGGKQLQNAAIGVEYDRSISADESVNHVSNMPRLMEYQGALTEFDVTSEWLVGIDHDRQWALWRLLNRLFHPGALAHRAPIPIPAIRSTAKVRVVPGLNTKASHAPGVAPRATRNTPRAVFDHAAVSYLDTTGLLDTARTTIGAMGQPGGAADEEISTFLNQAQILSHFREVVDGRYTTDTFFQPEFIRDKYRAVSLKADVGPAQFVGATDDPYILGLIKLSLTQTGQSSSRGSGIGGSPLDLAGGGDPGHSDVTNVSGSGTHTMRSGKSTTRGTKDTGGRESLEIAVTEGLAFRAPVSYALRIGKTKRAKLFANTDFVPVERRIGATDVEQMIFILSEPEALEHYATGDVPLDDEYLLKLLARWSSGELKISHRLMARVLMRWERDATATMVNPHRQLRADAV